MRFRERMSQQRKNKYFQWNIFVFLYAIMAVSNGGVYILPQRK